MAGDYHTISMDGSKYTWEQVDKKIKPLNFNRSEYVQRLIEKDLDMKKKDYRFIDVVILCVLAVVAMLMVLVALVAL